jgi:hypothetical protein
MEADGYAATSKPQEDNGVGFCLFLSINSDKRLKFLFQNCGDLS